MTAVIIKELTSKMQEQLLEIQLAKRNADTAGMGANLISAMSTLFNLSNGLPKQYDNIVALEEKTKLESNKKKMTRGGHEKGMYEDPEDHDELVATIKEEEE